MREDPPRPWRALHALPEPPQPSAIPAPDRRAVLRGAAASLALAAAAGCDAPDNFGQPLYSRPRGVAREVSWFATALELEGLGRGVLVRNQAGHAVKVEGNPAHPASLGATDTYMQAAILSLHDPYRSRHAREGGRPRPPLAAEAALAEAREALAARGGAGLRILTGLVASPTLARLIGEVLDAFPGAAWHQYGPLADDGALAGARLAFGAPVAVLPDLSRARAILSLGGGVLEEGPAQLRLARDWAAAREAGRRAGHLPSLLVAEATPSLTGAKADRRLVLRPQEIEPFARAVAAALGVPLAAPAAAAHPDAPRIAAALRRAGPEAVVLAGRGQPAAVHALAHAMNVALDAPGTTLRYADSPYARPEEAGASLRALAEAMAAGEVTHLLVLDANPVHTAPPELGLPGLIRRLPFSLHAGLYLDETGLACRWHLPLRHPFEAWGDSRAFDGTATIRQPATVPLVEAARGAEEILAALLGRRQEGATGLGEALVRETWRAAWQEAEFEARWRAALEEGVVEGTALRDRPARLREGWDPGPAPAPPAGTLAALFAPDPGLWDGAMAENAWLQELPRPLTRLAWGNAALLAPSTAEALGLAPGDEVELELRGRRLALPAWPMPGHAPDTVTLPLGHGRPTAGLEGGGGFDAYRLRPADAPWTAHGLVLRRTGGRRMPIATDHHHEIRGEEIIRTVAPGEELPPHRPGPSFYPPWPYPGHAWGMAIDLDSCIGCNACVVACQAENNIPVVGPEEVARGREMHWLRVERYFIGAPENPDTAFQPVPCMHCEKAPCEVVCPVNATVHDAEGLNTMIYPRCIGTRTCSNNCPYKVRRFNWFDYARGGDGVRVANPEVPLRIRGVIEKCTYCVQRIGAARAQARAEGRERLRDGEVVTACAQACPTQAILFGDINDPESAVARAKREGRNYALLGELDVRPRTTYLARVAQAPEGPAA
ncbi:4Fe-4S dicluster domain-containing protein [Crenalkalicoccus roseus]|uniref:4Fe-4S dicluster domain-containing protein n=1 Tax=Crenalkalicoccus roseus TaxID=1485588 RepID=UPI0010807417|nr:4Fe-4S dicluster domain-containing protein [Crenalkalicoccus roseus]